MELKVINDQGQEASRLQASDVLFAREYNEDLVHQELALYKLSTEKVLAHGSIEYLVRKYNVRILEVSTDCVVFLKAGHYEETQGLFDELAESIGVLQFVRSGRIAITKSKVERLSDMLAKREQERKRWGETDE